MDTLNNSDSKIFTKKNMIMYAIIVLAVIVFTNSEWINKIKILKNDRNNSILLAILLSMSIAILFSFIPDKIFSNKSEDNKVA